MRRLVIKNNVFQVLLCLTMSLFALFVSILLLIDIKKPIYYSLLFLLPLSFMVMSIALSKIYNEIPRNLGITMIIILLFVRTVLSPMFMYLGDYSITISYGIEKNTWYAILLVFYETICLFLLIYIKTVNFNKVSNDLSDTRYSSNSYGMRIYLIILIALSGILIICQYITPELLSSYRSIFDMSNEFFTNYEDSQTVVKYGTSFIKKLSLVTGQYLIRALLIIWPTYLIVKLSNKKTYFSKLISAICCFIPVFFIGGAIAKSLIYVVCLLFLYNYIYNNKDFTRKSIKLICFGGIVVIVWWILNIDSQHAMEQFSRRFSAYFSGVNVVSGVFNLPNSMEYKLRYFLYDFTSTIPFGNTIFGISHETIQPFFNEYNFSHGQIPPTIGLGYYYFGPILAPLYSLIFATIAINAGEKLKQSISGNPMKYIRLLITIFTFSMGIIMYNIEITMTSWFCLLIPMYILERISYKKEG